MLADKSIQGMDPPLLPAIDFVEELICIEKNGFYIKISANLKEILGYTDAELQSKPITQFIHPEDLAAYQEEREKLMGTTEKTSYEARFLSKDGSYKVIAWNTQQKNGVIYAVDKDVTLEKSLSEQIDKQKQKKAQYYQEIQAYKARKMEFIGNLCHELRNPLAGISGSSDILASNIESLRLLIIELETEPSKKELVEKLKKQLSEIQDNNLAIQECAQHQRVVLNDTLVLSKLESGAFELNIVAFNPKVVVESVLLMLQSTASQKSISIEAYLPDKDIRVLGDVNWLKHILLNVTSNAIKFTDKGGVRIKLEAIPISETDTELQFRVEDTGIGLTSDERRQLFKRFSQPSINVSDRYGGSGLGLFIAKQLIEKMGGSISVESEKGKGSSFIFNVKTKNHSQEAVLKAEAEAEAVSHKILTQLPIVTQRRNILLVEDNIINQRVTKKILEGAGHKVTVANNGKEATELWEEDSFDVVLMDMQMPVMDGIEATNYIRQKERELPKPATPIIGLSANALDQDIEKGIKAGMNDYMTKPFSKDVLLQKIEYFTLPPKLETGGLSVVDGLAASLSPTQIKLPEGKAKEGKGTADAPDKAMQEEGQRADTTSPSSPASTPSPPSPASAQSLPKRSSSDPLSSAFPGAQDNPGNQVPRTRWVDRFHKGGQTSQGQERDDL